MTTIAFDGKTIVADGRAVVGGVIYAETEIKIHQAGDSIYCLAGDCADIETVLKAIEARKKLPEGGSFVGFELSQSGGDVWVFHSTEGAASRWLCDRHWAVGTGDSFAIAAMDMGMTAKEAVAYASKRDNNTGRPFLSVEVATGKIKQLKG